MCVGAQGVAKVGGIEIPASQWPDLVPMLLGHATNSALPVGALHAVLMTLGYLLEEIVRKLTHSITLSVAHTHTHTAICPASLACSVM